MCFFNSSPTPSGNVDEVGEAGGAFPGLVVLREDERQDGREFRGAGIVAQVVAPDSDHVGEQTQTDERVFFVLMLEEDVEEGGLAVDLRGEEEIARGGGEFGVNKTAASQTQRAPINTAGEFGREVGLQKGSGVVGV
jgi:hypothetical protein